MWTPEPPVGGLLVQTDEALGAKVCLMYFVHEKSTIGAQFVSSKWIFSS